MPIYRVPVDITYPAAGGPGVNVWHVAVPDPVGTANAQAALEDLQAFYTAIRTLIPSTVTMGFAGVVTDVATGFQANLAPWSVAGSASANYAPLSSALCLTWRTQTAARTGVGRTFISPLAISTVGPDGTPIDAALTTARNAAAGLISANAAEFPELDEGWVVYSRKTGLVRRLQSVRVRDSFAVLRSRRD